MRRAEISREGRLDETPTVTRNAAWPAWLEEHAKRMTGYRTDLFSRWINPQLAGKRIDAIEAPP
jgi:hypothetical protein